MSKAAMAVHYSSTYDKWQTPPDLVARVACFYGGQIGLDPCTDAANPTHAIATFTGVTSPEDDGLLLPWAGQVFVNPPYGTAVAAWVRKALAELHRCQEILLLLPARTDTRWFTPLHEQVICYIKGRLRYVGPDDAALYPAPFPSCLVYLGPRPEEFALSFLDLGPVVAPYPRYSRILRATHSIT